jgi:hypothetical protein
VSYIDGTPMNKSKTYEDCYIYLVIQKKKEEKFEDEEKKRLTSSVSYNKK